MTKLKWIEIENFRGITKLRYEPKQINLIIGRNNSGKSSVLDALLANLSGNFNISSSYEEEFIHFENESLYRRFAVKLGCSRAKIVSDLHTVEVYNPKSKLPDNLLFAYRARVGYALNELFSNFGVSMDCFEEVRDFVQSRVPVSVSTFDDQVTFVLDPENLRASDEKFRLEYVKIVSLMSRARENANMVNEAVLSQKHEEKRFSLLNNFFSSLQVYLNRRDFRSSETVVKASGAGIFPVWGFKNEVRVIELENIVRENNIIANMERLTAGGVVYKDENGNLSTLPYAVHGEGFFSLLRLLYVMQDAKGGVFLIEEPENHMHPGYLSVFVEQVVSFAQKLDIQVFMTTHSADLIHEFARFPMSKDEEGMIQISNLVHRNGVHELFNHSPSEACHTIDDLLIDLRGT